MKVRVLFSGDCRLDGKFGRGICDLFQLFPGYDLYVLNLESSIQVDKTLPIAEKSVPIVASVDEAAHLVCQVDASKLVLNLANNHTGDAGQQNVDHAVRWFQDKGVLVIRSGDETSRRLGDTIIRFFAYDHPARSYLPSINVSPGDVAISLLHWGEEYVFAPSPQQRGLARRLINQGMRYVIGSHPHVLQGWETIGEGAVFYSLGNSVFGVPGAPQTARLGSVLSLVIDGECHQTEVIPVAILSSGSIKRLDADAETRFQRVASILTDHMRINALGWYAMASRPFFKNHMKSWVRRIQRHGFMEFLKMIRSLCGRTYLRMLAGLLMSFYFGKRQKSIEDLVKTVL